MRLVEDVGRLSGASREQVVSFIAKGMLLNVVAALELPEDYVRPLPRASDPALFFGELLIDRPINRSGP
jgi:hypothetical protein